MGPRDQQFVPLYKAIKRFGIYPRWGAGNQQYSLIYVKDLARSLLVAGEVTSGSNECYFVAPHQALNWSDVSARIGQLAGRNVRALTLPIWLLKLAAPIGELTARIAGRPALLSREKIREILADGWVCDSSKIERAWGFRCEASLDTMLRETYHDYLEHGLI
jgi:nucleoside-diphosphate-sugar epimerase